MSLLPYFRTIPLLCVEDMTIWRAHHPTRSASKGVPAR